jgi:hypothetical protein
MVRTKAAYRVATVALAAWTVVAAGGVFAPATAQAQTFPNLPITPGQRATAQQVAAAGVPLSELAPNAPDTYVVKRGDTLWHISGLFLRTPWRWPELWGMNLDQVRNPHLIFPGQTLYLETIDGLARLRMGEPPSGMPTDTVRVSPRTRISDLPDGSIPTLPPHIIEPFLNEAIIVGAGELEATPRIVAAHDERVLMTRGDRAYARGRNGTPLVERDPRRIDGYRVFRNARPLRDPDTQQILGYEAAYLGAAELVRSESVQPVRQPNGKVEPTIVPATIDITHVREEIRVGDRLVPEPVRQLTTYVPRAPAGTVNGRILSVYGDAVAMVGQSQVVTINKGVVDGIEPGHVLAIQRAGRRVDDRSIRSERAAIQLPSERNGLMMVFRTFERVSYALVLEITEPVQVGDRITNPR